MTFWANDAEVYLEILDIRSCFGVDHISLVSCRGSPQSSRDADTGELERLEKVWNEAHERGDADALQALWADDLAGC
jgi:hypothetical protein